MRISLKKRPTTLQEPCLWFVDSVSRLNPLVELFEATFRAVVWWSRRQVSESQHSTNASGQSPSRSDADTRYVSIKLASGNHLTTVVICRRLAHSMVSARRPLIYID